MQLDRAMAFLLEGRAIQRAAWAEPDNRRIENVDGKLCMAGTRMVFTPFLRPAPYIESVNIDGADMAADDWQVVHHFYAGDEVDDSTR